MHPSQGSDIGESEKVSCLEGARLGGTVVLKLRNKYVRLDVNIVHSSTWICLA